MNNIQTGLYMKQCVFVSNSVGINLYSCEMPTVKLTYFNLRARGEPARILLAYAEIDYEDNRLPAPWDDPEPWAALKPTTPYGELPILYWDGEEIAQSLSVARFLAKEFGLVGKTNLEAAQVDEVIYALQDCINAGYYALFEEDKERKKSMTETHEKETIPRVLGQIEKRLKVRGGEFLVGNQISWADIQTFFFCSELDDKDVLLKNPEVTKLIKKIGEIASISSWMEKRPKTNL